MKVYDTSMIHMCFLVSWIHSMALQTLPLRCPLHRPGLGTATASKPVADAGRGGHLWLGHIPKPVICLKLIFLHFPSSKVGYVWFPGLGTMICFLFECYSFFSGVSSCVWWSFLLLRCWDVWHQVFGACFLFLPTLPRRSITGWLECHGSGIWILCTSAGFVVFGVLQGYVLSSKGS